MAKTKRPPQVEASYDVALEKMRAALTKACGDIYSAEKIDERAKALLATMLRNGTVVLNG
jgi:outer membrane protein assembly factor BamA